jgi:hypothetical protein
LCNRLEDQDCATWSRAEELRKFITENIWTIGFVAAIIVLSTISLAVAFWAIAILT